MKAKLLILTAAVCVAGLIRAASVEQIPTDMAFGSAKAVLNSNFSALGNTVTNVGPYTLSVSVMVTNVVKQTAEVFDSTGAACSNAAGVAVTVVTNVIPQYYATITVVTGATFNVER